MTAKEKNRLRLLALARKTLDESSTEAERVASGQALAKEAIKLLEKSDAEPEPAESEEQRARRERAEQAVSEGLRRAAEPPASDVPKTWVDYDPPPSPAQQVGVPFGGEGFGRKPRPRR